MVYATPIAPEAKSMDNPEKLPDSGAAQLPDLDSGQSFGATGIFAAASESEVSKGSSKSIEIRPEPEQAQKPDAANKLPAMGSAALAEPVVHRVVLAHGNDAPSDDLIDRIRSSAAEREPDQAKAPVIGTQRGGPATGNAASGAGAGNVGFTQILRSMGLESETTQASAKPATRMTPPGSSSGDGFTAMISSFTSLAGTTQAGSGPAADQHSGAGVAPAPEVSEPRSGVSQNQDQPGFTKQFSGAVGGSRTFRAVPEQSAAAPPVAPSPAPRANASAPPDRQPGEFTRLFNSMGGADSGASEPQASRTMPSAAPMGEPGAFTSLFNSLGTPASGASEPQASRGTPSAAPAAEPGAFTRMFSSAAPSAPSGSEFREDYKPSTDKGSLDLSQLAAGQLTSIHDPMAGKETEEMPFAPTTPSGPRDSVTQLLRRLDSPGAKPDPLPEARREPEPVTPAATGGSGGLTAMFASLDQPGDFGGKLGAPAGRSTQQPPQNADRPPAGTASSSATGISQRAVPSAPPPPATSGPSEFTRILDASRIREMGLHGNQGAGASPAPNVQAQVPAAPAASGAPQMQMPNYAPSALPHMGAVPGMATGGQPGGYPPAQAPHMAGYPVSAGGHAGAVPATGGGIPHVPGVHVPTVAAPAVPKAPAMTPPAGGMGKLQQYVPLLLMLIIFLLVGLLVTVVFLMKK